MSVIIELFTGLAFFIYGMLHVWASADFWQRVYSAKNDRVVQIGTPIIGVLLILLGLGITLIAYSARIKFPDIDPAQSFVYGIQNMLSPGMLALGVILIFAAVMSSADTIIFVLATNFAKDGVARLKGHSLHADELRRYTRLSIIGIILIGTILAYFFRNIIDITLINAGIAMSVTPAIATAFKWRLNTNAIILSVVIGLLYTFFWIVQGKIGPETMISPVFVSTFALIFFQKLLKK